MAGSRVAATPIRSFRDQAASSATATLPARGLRSTTGIDFVTVSELDGHLQAPGTRPGVVLGFTPAGIALARGLGRSGRVVIGLSDPFYAAFGSRYFKEKFVAPRVATRPGELDMLAVLEQIATRGRPVVLTADEGMVDWLMDNWERVWEIADLPFPRDQEIVRSLRRKDLVRAEAERLGVRVPKTVTPTSVSEIHQCNLQPPLLVKPVEGKAFFHRFGVKLFRADSIPAAVVAWERAEAAGIATVVQELVPGAEGHVHSFFGYLDAAQRPLASVVGWKMREWPRPFGSSTVFVADWDDRVRDVAVRLLQGIGYRGLAHVELAYDRRVDDFVLIEVNTRAPTWAGIATTRAFNIAEVAYADLIGRDQEPRELHEKWVWVDLARDLAVGLPSVGHASSFAAPYLRRRRVGALFAWDDPVAGATAVLRSARSSLRLRTRLSG
jgi:D-aspartate ligase